MTVHRLKTTAEMFDQVAAGAKPFEARRADRDFKVGDVLLLVKVDTRGGMVFDDALGGQPAIVRRVSFVLDGGQYGIEADHCVMGLAEL